MLVLKDYLADKKISVKDFAKITKVKEEKIQRVLDCRDFFDNDEVARISAFLGVSKNEFYHGVLERKGELPEVAEQNNLNHFKYYVKNRFKGARRLCLFLNEIFGLAMVVTLFIYIGSLFLSGIGNAVDLRSFETILCCFAIPLAFIDYFWARSYKKVFKKRSVNGNEIKTEGIGISLMVLIYAVTSFIKTYITIETFVITVIAAILISVLSVSSVLKRIPLHKRFISFAVCMIPTALLFAADSFVDKNIEKTLPAEDALFGSISSEVVIGIIFSVLIIGVFNYCIILFFNSFVEKTGEYFQPMKKEKSISKKIIVLRTVAAIVLCCYFFVAVGASQGVFIKFVYSKVFAEDEAALNWTAESLTDYDTEYKKGEYQLLEYEGLQLKIPKGYSLDKETDYSVVYKTDEECYLTFSKPYSSESVGDFLNEQYIDGELTESQKERVENAFIENFGFYPDNIYDWFKLQGSVTLDDVEVFNPEKAAIMSIVLVMKSVTTVPNSKYYLYENGDLYATVFAYTIENDNGKKEIISVNFGSKNLEYKITFIDSDKGDKTTLEEVTKTLNSVNIK